jgi:hypothetical protein
MNEVATKDVMPAELRGFLGHPPLLISESQGPYNQVLAGTIETIDPQNAFEWFLAKDIADLTWEIRRLGKCKTAIVNMTWKEALRMLLESLSIGDPQERRRIAQERADAYFTKDGRGWVMTFLETHGLMQDAIAAQASTLRLPELEIIDRQLERARVIRAAIARDLQYHRVAGSWKRSGDLLAIVDANASSISFSPSADRAEPLP